MTPSPPVSLSLEDSELLSFYSSQSLSHLSCLADAIDSLFTSVQGNQPPRVFVSRGKSLIVTAHKLVFIGDTLARLLSSSDLRAKVRTRILWLEVLWEVLFMYYYTNSWLQGNVLNDSCPSKSNCESWLITQREQSVWVNMLTVSFQQCAYYKQVTLFKHNRCLSPQVTTSSGRLCQALKAVVVATKGAAQNYPSVPATQEMVDRVADLSQHAAGFSGLLQRLAEISWCYLCGICFTFHSGMPYCFCYFFNIYIFHNHLRLRRYQKRVTAWIGSTVINGDQTDVLECNCLPV